MYTAKLKLNNVEFEGKLTFETLKNIQRILNKEFNKKLNIQEIFRALGNKDYEVISCFVIETIKAENKNINEKIIIESFSTDGTDEAIKKFENIYKYITEILEECLPENKNTESEFEDEFEDIVEETKDWEFAWMQYLWESTLKRNDFYGRTAKEFFEQLDIYKKTNNVKEENVEEL